MKNGFRGVITGLVLGAVGMLMATAAQAQYTEWQNFTNGNAISDVVVNDTYAWIGTEGGLVRVTLSDTSTEFYDKVSHGLPVNRINALALENNGKLWIGTDAGLVSFHNSAWTTYTAAETGLPGDRVIGLTVAGNGDLWVGTAENGVARLRGTSTWDSWSTADGLGSDEVYCIAVTADDRVWLGTKGGYSVMTGSTWESFTRYTSDLPNNYILDMAIDGDGDLWFATFSGLAEYDGDSTWTVYKSSNSGLPNNNVYAVEAAADGRIWLGTRLGLSVLDDTVWTAWEADSSGLPYNEIAALALDASGNLWTGTGNGLAVFDEGGDVWVPVVTSKSDIPGNEVSAISEDLSGNLWVGTYNSGLGMFDGADWVLFNKTNSTMQENRVNTILTDTDGDVWVGTGTAEAFNGNLVKMTGTAMTPYNTHETGLPGYNVLDLFQAPDGDLWIGTAGNEGASGEEGGIAVFDRDSTWTVYDKTNSGLSKNEIPAMARDLDGSMWFSVSEGYMNSGVGIARFDLSDSSWTGYISYTSGLANDFILDIHIDENGTKWFGTFGGGVSVLAGTTWTTYDASNSPLPSDYINVICPDADGNLWIGTQGGLAVFDRDATWTVYTEKNSGLPNNNVREVYVAADSAKWIGTDGGMTVCSTCGGGETSGILPFVSGSTPSTGGPALSFANPADGLVTVALTGAGAVPAVVEIIDMGGNLVERLPAGIAVWNTAAVPVGMYVVRASSGTHMVQKSILVTR